MAWKVKFEKEARKELKKIDPQQAKRILKYLYSYFRYLVPIDKKQIIFY